ncbi:eukaryotic initiation factor 4A-3 [Pelomyxa schiedti]|nr:eukaryotic initiation factor 4A-3 [Pelomyxa schiedti]
MSRAVEEVVAVDDFNDMNLNEELLRGIYNYGFEKPSMIQQKAIRPLCEGRDVIAQAQSGTGKTGAFTIGALQRVDPNAEGCQALFLSPTRELANQTYSVISDIGQRLPISFALFIGGIGINASDARNCKVAVGTPGRVFDMIYRGFLDPRTIKILILDEADQLLDRNFKEQLYDIFQALPRQVQVGLFSATMPPEAIEITHKFMNDPVEILVKAEELTLVGMRQYYIDVEREDAKLDTLCDLYDTLSISQSVIFANSCRKVQFIADQLHQRHFTVSCTHSQLSPKERMSILKDFRSGHTRILISTDVLARGIDVQQVSLVINYDLPLDPETYIHRIGRSARFGRKGVAVNFATSRDETKLRQLEKMYDTSIVPMPTNIADFL